MLPAVKSERDSSTACPGASRKGKSAGHSARNDDNTGAAWRFSLRDGMCESMRMNTRIFEDGEELSRAALDGLLGIMNDAVKERGRFAIALGGGHTPAKLYQMWAQGEKTGAQTPWESVHLFWGDERYVAQSDPASNYRMARESLI